jgi:hypothetical protein
MNTKDLIVSVSDVFHNIHSVLEVLCKTINVPFQFLSALIDHR